MIPLLDLNAQLDPIRQDIEDAIRRVFDHKGFILGKEVQSFEKAIAQKLFVHDAIGVSSGSDALYLALRTLDIKEGDEVLTTSYSFFATAGAIIRVGATPVFIDIDPQSYNIDVSKLLNRISSKTAAILPVHLFGRCVDLQTLKNTKLPIIEDAAQALGAKLNEKYAGSIGDIGCFSFFPSKNLGGAGDGGMMTTQSASLASRLRSLRVHGQHPEHRYEHLEVGGNYRLDAIQAAILGVKLNHLERYNQGRFKNAERYHELFKTAQKEEILPPLRQGDIFNQFVIRVPEKKRDALKAHLAEKKIGSAIYYPRPLHLQPCFSHLGGKMGDCPHAEQAAKESLAIPIYPELKVSQIEYIVKTIVDFI